MALYEVTTLVQIKAPDAEDAWTILGDALRRNLADIDDLTWCFTDDEPRFVPQGRLATWIDLVEVYDGVDWDGWPNEGEPPERFLLIERNVGGSSPSFWASAHETADAAAMMHVSQEHASDWVVELLVDLDTGATFDVEVGAKAVPA